METKKQGRHVPINLGSLLRCTLYILVFAVIVMLLLLSKPAAADVGVYNQPAVAEVRIGVGENCGIDYGDGAWQQEGATYSYDKCGAAAALQYIGTTPVKSGRLSLNYSVQLAYRKGSTVTGGDWVDDDCYSRRQRSGGTLMDVYGVAVMGQCDRRYTTQLVETTTRAIMLSLDPTYRLAGDLSVSAQLGLSFYESKVKVDWDHTKGICSMTACQNTTYSRRGVNPFLSLSMTYDLSKVYTMSLTAYIVPVEHAPESPDEGNYGRLLMIGRRF